MKYMKRANPSHYLEILRITSYRHYDDPDFDSEYVRMFIHTRSETDGRTYLEGPVKRGLYLENN